MHTIQGIQQQQIMAGERPIMPVVSMSAQPANQPVQQLQQTIPGTLSQALPLQPNLAVTQQMQMGVQQIHPVSKIMKDIKLYLLKQRMETKFILSDIKRHSRSALVNIVWLCTLAIINSWLVINKLMINVLTKALQ